MEIEIRSKDRGHRWRPKEEGKGEEEEEEKENQNNRCELSEHEPNNCISVYKSEPDSVYTISNAAIWFSVLYFDDYYY